MPFIAEPAVYRECNVRSNHPVRMAGRLAHCNVDVRFVEAGSCSFSSRCAGYRGKKTDTLTRQDAGVKAEALCLTVLSHPASCFQVS